MSLIVSPLCLSLLKYLKTKRKHHMIDTIKLRIPLSSGVYDLIEAKSLADTKTTDRGYTKHFAHRMLPLGKNGYEIKTYARMEQDDMFIEFSLPKYFFGHNVYMFYPSDLKLVLNEVKGKLEAYFEITLPEITSWTFQRIDICYAFKLPTQEEARHLLLLLHPYSFPRKEKVIFHSGIEFRGTTFKLKYYLKHDELLSNKEYKRLKKNYPNKAEFLSKLSEGVLRFEISLFKKHLFSLYKRDTTYKDFTNQEYLEGLLNQYLKILIGKCDAQTMDILTSWQLLNNTFKKNLALDLFQYHVADKLNVVAHEIMEDQYNSSTINRKKKLLAQAQVGILDTSNTPSFNYLVPHEFAINKSNTDVAEATSVAQPETKAEELRLY